MKRSPLTYFAWISLVAVLFSCASPKIIISPGMDDQSMDISDKSTYKATVMYQDKEISGRVLIKKTGEETYRVAFFNEMGMTYLEGTLKGRNLEIKNIMPVLDEKLFINKFEKKLRLIL
jgi:hypothetical protein